MNTSETKKMSETNDAHEVRRTPKTDGIRSHGDVDRASSETMLAHGPLAKPHGASGGKTSPDARMNLPQRRSQNT